MLDVVIRFLAAAGTMAILDGLWLTTVANKFYKSQLSSLLLDKPRLGPAILFYLVYIIGILLFVVNPALEKHSLAHAAGYGALFGLVAYATYDLTNLATLKGFTIKLVVVDLLWGMLLTAIVAVVTFAVANRVSIN